MARVPLPCVRLPSGVVLLWAALLVPACGEGEPAGPPAFDPAPCLRDLALEDPARRVAAVRALGEAPRMEGSWAEPLARALGDENRWVREWAARALTRLGPAAAPAVAALNEALYDRDSFVRFRAAEALGAIGPAAREALPRLEEMAASTDETEVGRSRAQEAVQAIRAAAEAPR